MRVFNGTIRQSFSPFIKKCAQDVIQTIYSHDKAYSYKLPIGLRNKGRKVADCVLCTILPYDIECNRDLIDASGRGCLVIYPDRIITKQAQNKRVDDELVKILTHIPLKDDLSNAKMIHDYVCEKLHYCNEKHNGNYEHLSISFTDLVFSNCCVCNGYARLYSALCYKAGLNVQYLSGSNHAWNRVKIGTEWLYVDCTWDDGEHVKGTYCLKTNYEFYTLLKHPIHEHIGREGWEI